MHVLGISAFHGPSSAAILRDGEILAAAEESSFTRRLRDESFPARAVRHCLDVAGVTARDVEYIGYHEKPLVQVERWIETQLARAPAGFSAFRSELPAWLGRRLHVARELDRGLGLRRKRYVFAGHHESHAAAAFFPSPFTDAAILVLDGGGEWATTTLGVGRQNRIELVEEIRHPHSIGGVHAAFAAYLGLWAGAEGEIGTLAAQGVPRFAAAIRERILDLKDDGSFWVDADFFEQSRQGLTTAPRFHSLFGGPPRASHEAVEPRHRDVAASIQAVVEDVVLALARRLRETTRLEQCVVGGGVASNERLIGRLARDGSFAHVWVPPAPGNAGNAIGVALFVHHRLLGRERVARVGGVHSGARLGPRHAASEVAAFLTRVGARHETLDPEALRQRVVALLREGRIVAWFDGASDFGARASGSRVVLADARRPAARAALSSKLELRRVERQPALFVLARRAHEWFDVPPGFASPHRSVIVPVAPMLHGELGDAASIQTASHDDGSGLGALLDLYERATGCPALAIADFQVPSEPVVLSPADAWRAFMSSGVDALAIEGALVVKSDMTAELEARRRVPEADEERDPAFERLAACPACGGEFRVEGARATCTRCGVARAREEGIWKLFQPNEPYEGDVTDVVKSFYEEHPFPNYDAHESVRSLLDKARLGVYARLLGEQIPFDSRVIEVGCGTGQLSNFLGIGCRTVVGADLCLNSLRLAEGFRRKHALDRVRFAQMNLFRPAFAPGSFDVVLCNGVLLTTMDPRGGFESIARLVKPGGHIVIGLYNWWGRLPVDARRVIFRLTGGRMLWLDPRLAKVDSSDAKKDAWYHDQYKHPHETKQTQGEVLEWFDRAGFEFVNAVPKTNPWEPFTEDEQLFQPSSRGTPASRGLSQARMILSGWIEGGFFVMIGKKKA